MRRFQFDTGANITRPVEGEAGSWNKLVPLGTFHRADFPKGGLTITPATLTAMVDNWKAEGATPLPVDYHHEEAEPASGWIEALEVRPDGLWGRITWTDTARAHILADEYRYLSPTFSLESTSRKSGKKIGPRLWGAALLNDPFFNELPRVAASTQPQADEAATQENSMDKKRICAALGLPEDTEDENVMAAVEAACKAMAEAKKCASDAEGKLQASAAAAEAALSTLEAEKKMTAALTEKVAKLEAARVEADTSTLIGELLRAGRIAAAEQELVKTFVVKMGLEDAKRTFGAWPVRHATTEVGISTKADETPDLGVLKAKYETALDEKVKAGMSVSVASRELRRLPEYLPLFK